MAVALGQHAPGGLGGDERRRRSQTAGLLDARPKLSQAAELGDGEELILVGGEPEIDIAACVFELDALRLECAQVGNRFRKNEAKLLRLRAARRMHRPAVGHGKRPGKTFVGETGDEPSDHWGEFGPMLLGTAANGHGADRVEAEAQLDRRRIEALGDHVIGDEVRRAHRGRSEIEFDRDPPIEMHAGERLRDGLLGGRQREAVIAGGAVEHELHPARRIVQIVEYLRVRSLGIGKVDPLRHGPWRGRGASRDDAPVLGARIKRLDDDTVIGGRAQRFERRALQRLGDQLLPIRKLGLREISRQ